MNVRIGFLFFLRLLVINRLKAGDKFPTFDIADKDDAITWLHRFLCWRVEPHYYHKERGREVLVDPPVQVLIIYAKALKSSLPKMVTTTIFLRIRQSHTLTSSWVFYKNGLQSYGTRGLVCFTDLVQLTYWLTKQCL